MFKLEKSHSIGAGFIHLNHVSSSGDFKTDKTGSFGRVETDSLM